jgi:MEMO1 family protein
VLRKFVTDSLCASVKYDKKPTIIISPHAGYMYSGALAATAFKQLENLDQNIHYEVLLIGPSHRVYLDSASFSPDGIFMTPLGKVHIDMGETMRLSQKFPNILNSATAHKLEHSLEVELPFLQSVLKDFSLIPLVYGGIEVDTLYALIDEFLVDDSRICVISSDLSHYYSQEKAKELDSYCIDGIERLDLDSLGACEACGKGGIMAAIQYALKHNLKSKTLDYKTSGDITGDTDRVVGYGSFMFYKEEQ